MRTPRCRIPPSPRLLGALATAALLACGPAEVPDPIYLVVDWQGQEPPALRAAAHPELTQQPLTGLGVRVFAGGRFRYDPAGGPYADRAALRAAVVVAEGEPLHLDLRPTQFGGVRLFAPGDARTLLGLSAWHHLVGARRFLRERGGDERGCLDALDLYLSAPIETPEGTVPSSMAWYGAVPAFVATPYVEDGVPPAANPGIVAHELTHALVFCHLDGGDPVRASRPLHPEFARWSGIWLEGIADYVGAAYSGDARFLRWSLPALDEGRRLDRRRRWPPADPADPYAGAAILSAALWSLRGEIDPVDVDEAVLRSVDAAQAWWDAEEVGTPRTWLQPVVEALVARGYAASVVCGALGRSFDATDVATQCAERGP
ncbi:MAG: hypothetical protein D6729_08580 [Deltaproteobacteria bacterium]|nr:MAG: hypothetical protein D6729_08580 [Deltaproteobacteria bacterium]